MAPCLAGEWLKYASRVRAFEEAKEFESVWNKVSGVYSHMVFIPRAMNSTGEGMAVVARFLWAYFEVWFGYAACVCATSA